MVVRASDKVTLAVLPHPSYVRLYYVLQASGLAAPAKPTVNPPAAPWTATEPAYVTESTNTLYTVMLTAYGSITFEYGAVQVSSSYEAAKAAYNLAFQANGTANGAVTTANGKSSVIRSTLVASTPASYKLGDQWWRILSTQVIGIWIHDGTNWLAQTLTSAVITNLDAGVITAGTINAARISGTALDGKTITGALIRSAASGQRVELSSAGLKGYGADGLVKTSIGTDGVLSAVGSISTGTTGQRAELSSTSAKFWSPDNKLASITAVAAGGVDGSRLQLSSTLGMLDIGHTYLPLGGTVEVYTESMLVANFYANAYRNGVGDYLGGQAWFVWTGGAVDNAEWHVAMTQEVGPTNDSAIATYASDGSVQAMRIARPGLYQITASVRMAAQVGGRSFIQIGQDAQRYAMRSSVPGGEDVMAVSATIRTYSNNEFVRTYFYKSNGSLGTNTFRTSITRLVG